MLTSTATQRRPPASTPGMRRPGCGRRLGVLGTLPGELLLPLPKQMRWRNDPQDREGAAKAGERV